MDYLTYSERLNYLLEMIEKGRLHSPCQMSEKFECSERTVRRMIGNLREMGHQVEFCKKNKKYFIKT